MTVTKSKKAGTDFGPFMVVSTSWCEIERYFSGLQ